MQDPEDIDTAFEIDNLLTFLLTFLPYHRAIWIQIIVRFRKRFLKAGRYGKKY